MVLIIANSGVDPDDADVRKKSKQLADFIQKILKKTNPVGRAADAAEAFALGVQELYVSSGAKFDVYIELSYSCCECVDEEFTLVSQPPWLVKVEKPDSGNMGEWTFKDMNGITQAILQAETNLRASAKQKCKSN